MPRFSTDLFWTEQFRLPALGLLAALVILAYFLTRAASWREDFGLFDGLILVVAMAVGTAAGIPFFEASQRQARETVLLETLQTYRTQIELYRAQHNGQPPLVYQGRFPQLTSATDAQGVPGAGGPGFPFGPYFSPSLPSNPLTGVPTVTAVSEFPPAAPSGKGGWIYHQASGRLGIDLEGFLDR